jgi:hypothetical protein
MSAVTYLALSERAAATDPSLTGAAKTAGDLPPEFWEAEV